MSDPESDWICVYGKCHHMFDAHVLACPLMRTRRLSLRCSIDGCECDWIERGPGDYAWDEVFEPIEAATYRALINRYSSA